MKFLRKLIAREVVAYIPIEVHWTDTGSTSQAFYALTKTFFGTRSWFLIGSIWPCDEDSHQRFKHVVQWMHNGTVASCAEPAEVMGLKP